jgi:hypothetical protein
MKKIVYLLIPILTFLISCDKNEDVSTEKPSTVPTNPSDGNGTKTTIDGVNINVLYINGVPVINNFTVKKKDSYFVGKNRSTIEYSYKEVGGVPQWVWTEDILTNGVYNQGDTIVIEYTPDNVDKVTKVKDIQQKECIFNGKTLDVDLEHVNAKLTFDIKLGNNYNLNLDTYKVSVLGKYTLSYGETHSVILEPQTIPVGSLIKVETEVAGEVFTKTLTEPLVLEANKELTVSLEMSPITRSFSVSTSTFNWVKDHIDLGQIVDVEGFRVQLPTNGEFEVIFKDLSKSFNYQYNKTTQLLTPQLPYLYWGNFQNHTKYAIYGKFTPDTEGIPEKDVLKTKDLSLSWGDPFNFNLSIHANSLLTFHIVNGGGYSAEQFEEHEKKATIEIEGLYEPSTYKSQLDKDIIVKPKILTDDDKFILTLNDKKYEVKMKDVEMEEVKMTQLIENKNYDITLNVIRSASMTVEAEIKDWVKVSVDGVIKIED